MKLSHLSLAVLSAIALAACGGSNNDQTTPVKPQTNSDANDGAVAPHATTPTTPEVKDPNASVPVTNNKNATFIDPASAENTAAAKQITFGRKSRDTVIGYSADGKQEYKAGSGDTDREDIMRADSIIANYLNSGLAKNKAKLFSNVKNGLMFNPVQTYVKGSDGKYYRVYQPKQNGNAAKWDDITSANFTEFTFNVVTNVSSVKYGADKVAGDANGIKATDLVYIPNAGSGTAATSDKTVNKYYLPDNNTEFDNSLLSDKTAGLNVIDLNSTTPTDPVIFAPKENEVVPTTLHFNEKSYVYATLSPNVVIDMELKPDAKVINHLPITVDYQIIDDKHTDNTADDDFIKRTLKSGEAMVYNLNYSRAMVQINEAARVDQSANNARTRNVLNQPVDGDGYYGAFQVVGRQTGTLPNNGRAVYTGKSFGLDRTGDIKLEADFGKDRASISGSVFNRVDSKNNALPTIKLQQIMLSQPNSYEVTASKGMSSNSNAKDGKVLSADASVNGGTWAVSLFGANAENAGGVIFDAAVGGKHNVVEAFGSARGDITPKSLNN